MQYLYSKLAGERNIVLENDEYRYLAKVRRVKKSEKIPLRNLQDDKLYIYEISQIGKKSITLNLKEEKSSVVASKRYFHLGWCVIEPKNIQKTLPSLNEIGVSKISFIYCQRSQKNYKIDLEKLQKILINSSQQSGRSKMMKLEVFGSLEEFLSSYPDSFMLNFSEKKLEKSLELESVIVGCEGGFSQEEISLFEQRVVGLDTSLILQSQTATIATASIMLL